MANFSVTDEQRRETEAIEVVRSLYGDWQSFALGSLLVIATALTTAWKTWEPAIFEVTGVIAVLTGLRLASMLAFHFRGEAFRGGFWKALYVVLGTLHVASVGAWSTVVFACTDDAFSEMSSFATGIAYLIGIQGRNFSSPVMVRLQILAAAVPILMALLIKDTPWYYAQAMFFTMFLASILMTSKRMGETFINAIRAAAENERLAFSDNLTGLPNRARMQRDLAAAVGDRSRPFALHFVDLDRFKRINDTLGHGAGDRLLIEAARRLSAAISPSDRLARYAGDEFVVLQRNLPNEGAATQLAARLIDTVSQPIDLDGFTAHVGCSVGIAVFPFHGESVEALTQHADTALYRVKSEERGRFAIFTSEMADRAKDRLRVETALRDALAAADLKLVFQPLFDPLSRRITTCEALVRWTHPEIGNIPPSDFLPIAEESGLMKEVTDFTIRRACHVAAKWPAATAIAINLSPSQLHRADLIDLFMSAVEDAGIEPARVEIELTENLSVDFGNTTLAKLEALKAKGFRLSLDDFGTGYANLGQISRLPIDKIKIDKCFLRDLHRSDRQRALLRGVIRFASLLGLDVVVEGIETMADLQFVAADARVTQLQGFIFGSPLPEFAIADLIHTVNRSATRSLQQLTDELAEARGALLT